MNPELKQEITDMIREAGQYAMDHGGHFMGASLLVEQLDGGRQQVHVVGYEGFDYEQLRSLFEIGIKICDSGIVKQ